MTPVSVRLLFQQLTCSVLFVKCPSLSVNSTDMTSSPRNNVAVLG